MANFYLNLKCNQLCLEISLDSSSFVIKIDNFFQKYFISMYLFLFFLGVLAFGFFVVVFNHSCFSVLTPFWLLNIT